ncbi:MAG: ZIP family zinc transporter [Solirubrobacteraceae bacterium]
MGEALFWGAVASSSLVLGGLIAVRVRIARRPLGLIMAFGAGVLISAVAYELVEEAFQTSSGGAGVGLGLALGSLAFFTGDLVIDRLGGADRKRSHGAQASGVGLAIVLGIVLDGIPESIVLGLTVLTGEGVSLAMLVAVFLSNLPEAVAATVGLRDSGWSTGHVIGLWLLVTAVAGIAALLGYVLFDGASPRTIAFVMAFAAGAILTMLADTMMPEAFEHGGPYVGLATTAGFGLAFAISESE